MSPPRASVRDQAWTLTTALAGRAPCGAETLHREPPSPGLSWEHVVGLLGFHRQIPSGSSLLRTTDATFVTPTTASSTTTTASAALGWGRGRD